MGSFHLLIMYTIKSSNSFVLNQWNAQHNEHYCLIDDNSHHLQVSYRLCLNDVGNPSIVPLI